MDFSSYYIDCVRTDPYEGGGAITDEQRQEHPEWVANMQQCLDQQFDDVGSSAVIEYGPVDEQWGNELRVDGECVHTGGDSDFYPACYGKDWNWALYFLYGGYATKASMAAALQNYFEDRGCEVERKYRDWRSN